MREPPPPHYPTRLEIAAHAPACAERKTQYDPAQPLRKVGSTAARQLSALARWAVKNSTH
ncbi:hypothetical protein LMG27177_00758 [Paraburkholderia fynbosensis]|uniref:Uncharacterized protein n=1 Tax=Paraburkholderia fynbosensis TaxID=1200993 RepID=A0A6J5FJD7_9BURK|nr:hypothetical protein LMG27177_00758 [Paraburkholderia fynbosensis]